MPWSEGEIRIRLTSGGGGWSKVGTGALSVPKDKQTMQLGVGGSLRPVTIHEFGHAIIEYAECPACQFEVILSDQSDRNEARIRDEQRKIDGLLTCTELTQLREHFHLTPTQAAQLFGDPAFAKYETGEETQSVTLNKLIKLALTVPLCFEELCKMAEVKT